MSKVTIKDSVVFVTGANRGIGFAIAQEAITRGAKKIYAACTHGILSGKALGRLIDSPLEKVFILIK